MVRLPKDLLQKVYTMYLKDAKAYIQEGLANGTEQVLLPLQVFFKKHPRITKTLAQIKYDQLLNEGVLKAKALDKISPLTLAIYAWVENDLVYVQSTNAKIGFSIYTRNTAELLHFSSIKKLDYAAENDSTAAYNKISGLLVGGASVDALKTNVTVYTVRLDAVCEPNNSIMLTGVRESVDYTKQAIIPQRGISDVAWPFIVQASEKGILKLHMFEPDLDRNDGSYKVKDRSVTRNQAILNGYYDEVRVERALNYSNITNKWTGKYYLPVLGASVESIGVTRVLFGTLKSIQFEKFKNLNVDHIDSDLTTIRNYFDERVAKLIQKGDIDSLNKLANHIGAEVGATPFDTQDNIRQKANMMRKHELLEFMERGRSKTVLKPQSYIKRKGIFEGAERVYPLPSTVSELVTMLNDGLYSITYMTRGSKGKPGGNIVGGVYTNNHALLMKYVGEDYVYKYEPDKTKIVFLEHYLQTKNYTPEMITNIIGYPEMDEQKLLALIEDMRTNPKKHMPKKSLDPNVALIRGIDTRSYNGTESLFRQVQLDMIIDMYKLKG